MHLLEEPRHEDLFEIYENGPDVYVDHDKKDNDSAHPAALSPWKRFLDIAIALISLLFMLPTMLLAAFFIAATSRGPIFFRQTRTGHNGREFQILKFRSMYVMENGGEIRHATRGDKRVTPVGAILRATSVDELPQLINVLRGEMSLVGPRPHAISHDRLYGDLITEYSRRFAVKPGITGLAQVRGFRGDICDLSFMERRVQADCEYIERWTLRSDLAILLRTLPCLVRDRNAY
jgi:putative colanic acid biosynthesis UDP-glucose lipid carrier transferase